VVEVDSPEAAFMVNEEDLDEFLGRPTTKSKSKKKAAAATAESSDSGEGASGDKESNP
jgi:hypothetical protein